MAAEAGLERLGFFPLEKRRAERRPAWLRTLSPRGRPGAAGAAQPLAQAAPAAPAARLARPARDETQPRPPAALGATRAAAGTPRSHGRTERGAGPRRGQIGPGLWRPVKEEGDNRRLVPPPADRAGLPEDAPGAATARAAGPRALPARPSGAEPRPPRHARRPPTPPAARAPPRPGPPRSPVVPRPPLAPAGPPAAVAPPAPCAAQSPPCCPGPASRVTNWPHDGRARRSSGRGDDDGVQ